MADWIKKTNKQEPTICCWCETCNRAKDTCRLKVKGLKKRYFMQMEMTRKWELTIFMSDKKDFKTKAIKKDKKGHYIIIKGLIQEEDITFININAPNIGTPKYIKQILTEIKVEADRNTVIVGDLNTPLTSMDRFSRQKSIQQQRS